jgi:hypothetical protein
MKTTRELADCLAYALGELRENPLDHDKTTQAVINARWRLEERISAALVAWEADDGGTIPTEHGDELAAIAQEALDRGEVLMSACIHARDALNLAAHTLDFREIDRVVRSARAACDAAIAKARGAR